jgi:hypothetical protein
MTTTKKVLIVGGGYLAALGVAWLAVTLYITATNTPDRLSSAGMYAFGDLVFFLGALGLASLPATGAALYFLRNSPWFWQGLTGLALLLTATAALAGIAYFTAARITTGWWATLATLSPLRILAAPLFALFCLLAALFAPARRPRIVLLVAVSAEFLLFVAFIFWVASSNF